MSNQVAVSTAAQSRRSALRSALTGVACATAFVAVGAHAAEGAADPYGIAAIVSAAKDNSALVVTGLIGLAGLGFGLAFMLGLFRK